MCSVRENVMYMLSFEKFADENPVCDEHDSDNDVKNAKMSFETSNTNNASSIFQKNISKSWLYSNFLQW